MPEREPPKDPLKELDLDQLLTMSDVLDLYEIDGQDVTELREQIWEVINQKMNVD